MPVFTLRLASPEPSPGTLLVAVKDLIDMKGLPTTRGSRVLAERAAPAPVDAACLRGLRAAEASGRAVVVGRTNLHELAFGTSGVNPWYGTPVNPLDPRLVPGGSSSGSAVAVATGAADVAYGTDTGGSVRIPAACCGVVGLKTTFGRVALEGVAPLAPSLDTVGPMAATVALTAAGMELLEPGFAWTACAPASRIGRFRPPAEAWVDDAVDAALAAMGAKVREVELPGWAAATGAFETILAAEAWAVYGSLWATDAARLSPDVASRLEAASRVAPPAVAAAWEEAQRWRRSVSALWPQVEVMALPTLADAPPPLEEAARMGGLRLTGPWNLAGVPALALPVPAAGPGPASLQLVGPAGTEDLLLATGAALEAALAG
jgi:amidase